MSSTTRTQSTDVRFPLIVVDWAQDRHRYDSGWLQLIGPADLPQLQQHPTTQIWDGNGCPVTVHGPTVTITSAASDPAVRNILLLWRSRVPVPVMPASMSGDTAIPFLVDDVFAARTRLDESGATPKRSALVRLIPVLLMLLSAAAIVPLIQRDLLGVAIAFIGYVVASSLMVRWSDPTVHWGDPPHRDPHDVISRLAVGARIVFWAVAAAAATVVVLDWAEVAPGLLNWV